MKVEKKIQNQVTRQNKSIAIPVFICINIVAIILSWSFPHSIVSYNIDNYRNVYSALLQLVGSIFAFIASSTLIILQLLHSNSPNSARFFPKKTFSSFLIVTLIILICDTIAVLSLKAEISLKEQLIINWLIIENVSPIFLAFLYTLYFVRYLSPKYQVEHIIKEAKRANTNEDRRIIIYSLEEMLLSAIKGGQGGNVRLYQDALSYVIEIFTDTNIELNARSKSEPDNPLRIIPGIIERIVSSMINNDMPNLLHYNGHILRQLSGSKYKKNEIVTVEISSAIGHIANACMDNSRLIDLSNFCANFIMCADDKNGLNTIFWSIHDLAKQLTKQSSEEDVSYIFSHIVNDLDYLLRNTNARHTPGAERIVSFIENQKGLIAICEASSNNRIEKQIKDIRRYIATKDPVTG